MAERTGGTSAARVVLVLAALVIVVAGLKLASSVLSPIILGAFFAVVSYPAIAALRRRGLPTGAAIAVTSISVVVVMVLVGLVLYSSLSQLSEELPTYEAQMAERTESVDAWLQDHGIDASGTLGLAGFTGRALADVAARLIGAILEFLSSFLLLLMLTVFFLVDAGLFVAKGATAPGGRRGTVAGAGGLRPRSATLLRDQVDRERDHRDWPRPALRLVRCPLRAALGHPRLFPQLHPQHRADPGLPSQRSCSPTRPAVSRRRS